MLKFIRKYKDYNKLQDVQKICDNREEDVNVSIDAEAKK